MDADADGAMRPEAVAKIAVLAMATGFGGLMAAVAPAQAPTAVVPSEPDPGAERLIDALISRLLDAHSATAVLEAWCGERGLSADPKLVAVRVGGIDKVPTPGQRGRLAVGPDEPIRYRHVQLTCGGHVLSEADNWYVPSRLTPAMNAVLDTTLTPFGRVVHPLAPTRRNLSLRALWTPNGTALPAPDTPLFAVEAVLSTGAGLPFCEVAETYTGAVLLHRAP